MESIKLEIGQIVWVSPDAISFKGPPEVLLKEVIRVKAWFQPDQKTNCPGKVGSIWTRNNDGNIEHLYQIDTLRHDATFISSPNHWYQAHQLTVVDIPLHEQETYFKVMSKFIEPEKDTSAIAATALSALQNGYTNIMGQQNITAQLGYQAQTVAGRLEQAVALQQIGILGLSDIVKGIM